MPNSFVFDPNRCTGCHACRLACTIENGLAPRQSWRRIETFNPRRHPTVPLFHLSLACNHCAEPACMYACPALAYRREATTGAVLLDEAKCIGCRYCSWACPYDAPVFDPSRAVMSKCTFCIHRLRDGGKPACAALCPTEALDVADLPEADATTAVVGFPQTDLQPRIRILPLRSGRELPVMASATESASLSDRYRVNEGQTSGISLRSEWSLAAFTWLAAALVAGVAATLLAPFALHYLAFLGVAGLSLALSSAHLGRPERAYLALLNLRRSWLSREVASFSLFVVLGTAYLVFVPENRLAGAAAVIAGLLALFSADHVYRVLERGGPHYPHSAGVLWTGLLLTAVFSEWMLLAALLGLGKLASYAARKLALRRRHRVVRPLVSGARVGVGLVLPAALWLIDPARSYPVIVVAVLLGELIDRCEFYAELQARSPRRQMAMDLARELESPARRAALTTQSLA